MRRFLPRLTFANVIASLALFIALGGAAVAAGIPRNSVGPKQIKKGAVTANALRKSAVRPGKIAPRAVVAGKLGPRAVLPSNLGAGIISTSKISAGAVNAEKIRNNVVTTNKLNRNAVTTAKLADENVTTAKLAEGAVNAKVLAKGSVTTEKLSAELQSTLNNVNPLKSGQTERGIFDIGGYSTTTEETVAARGSISFQQALASNPVLTIVKKGGPYPPACPGLGAGETTPAATAGNLCVYTTIEVNLDETAPLAVDGGTNRLGTGLVAKSKKAKGEFAAVGVWAVTAP